MKLKKQKRLTVVSLFANVKRCQVAKYKSYLASVIFSSNELLNSSGELAAFPSATLNASSLSFSVFQSKLLNSNVQLSPGSSLFVLLFAVFIVPIYNNVILKFLEIAFDDNIFLRHFECTFSTR